MNNIEEIIGRLKTRVALAELIGPDEMIVSASDLSALIAQLEAAQKLNPLSVNVSELEATYIGDIRLHMAAISDWKSRAKKAEAELSAANEKPKPISFDELADRVQFVTGGIRMSFDPLNCKGHQIVPFMNFNSLSRIVEMYRTTETYHLAGFTVEGE